MEYAIDVAKAARTRGVRSVAVTAGYMCPEPRAEFFKHMDAANIDLKGFTADFYRKVCGAELAAVLETLEYVHHETRVWLEVTTLLIPGLNDSDSRTGSNVRLVLSNTSARTCRFTSRRSIRTGRCAMCERLRWPPSDAHVRLRYGMVCVTSTRATCATSKAPAPGATRAGPR